MRQLFLAPDRGEEKSERQLDQQRLPISFEPGREVKGRDDIIEPQAV
jgi:hypothetical protein